MAIVPDELIGLDFPGVEASYVPRDATLYALGIGIGLDPLDSMQLAYVRHRDPLVIPSFATVLGYDRFWAEHPRTGIDASAALHVNQGLTIHRPLAATGKIVRETRVVGVTDRGPGRGAFVRVRESVFDAGDRALIAELTSTVLCRAEGGCGSAGEAAQRGEALPTREPDVSTDIPTSPQQALVYQLSGDRNPIHVDPCAARRAGFDRPILHGLSTFGMACRTLTSLLCANEPARLKTIEGRFASVVIPGETLRLEMWDEGRGDASFRLTLADRQGVPIDNGRVRWAPSF